MYRVALAICLAVIVLLGSACSDPAQNNQADPLETDPSKLYRSLILGKWYAAGPAKMEHNSYTLQSTEMVAVYRKDRTSKGSAVFRFSDPDVLAAMKELGISSQYHIFYTAEWTLHNGIVREFITAYEARPATSNKQSRQFARLLEEGIKTRPYSDSRILVLSDQKLKLRDVLTGAVVTLERVSEPPTSP
jgi:hypothetical protein